MATLADSLVSSASRPLSLRMRPDLTARRQRYHGRTYWVVKEPVGLNYFRFHEEEFAILCMLDGYTSMEQIKTEFEQKFAPQKITFQDLQQFIGMLHRSGLVVSNASGQGRQLNKRRGDKKRRELLAKFSNVFALRWRGIDPERILNRLYPYTAWFFSPTAIFTVVTMAIAALLLVAVQFDVFQSRLPSFHEFFGPKNWPYLAVAMAIAKVLHEFGHGLACKHFKGECHEMGFMLLVFTPALYCNVSDSWMLPNKWHRVFIGAAGIYVEICLASIATFLWWFSDPTTLINQVSLSMMFICSVSTILFNGNPLLRFDGYYILMDIIEIPNLRQKSTEVLKRFMVNMCLGIEQPENPFLPQEKQFLFGLYTIAAVIYRWVVVLSILMFLNKVLEPYGLKIIGRMIGFVGVFGLVVQPLFNLAKFFYIPGRMHKVKRHRVVATLAVAAGLVLVVIFLPLPYHVDCAFDVKARDAETVYASVPGRLTEVMVRPGQWVTAQDTTLATMENLDLQLTVVDLEGQIAEAELEQRSLDQLAAIDGSTSAALRRNEVRQRIEALNVLLDERRTQLDKLVIKAPIDGTVLEVPDKSGQPSDESGLPEWSGSALAAKNRGAYLMPRDVLCQIGDPKRLVAELIVDQADVDLVREGHLVDLMLEAHPGVVYSSKIEKVSLPELKVSPLSISTQAGGDLDTVTDEQGRPRPLSTSYPALADLPITDGNLPIGLRGKAKIYTGWQPLGRRMYRFLARTFHFEF